MVILSKVASSTKKEKLKKFEDYRSELDVLYCFKLDML